MDFVKDQSEREEVGETILFDRQLVIDYDRRRNSNREALRALQKSSAPKAWVNLGDMFIRLPTDTASSMVQEEQGRISDAVDETRERIKENAKKLEEMDGLKSATQKNGAHLKAFDLKPLSAQELYHIAQSAKDDN
ncbi:hypothetical protein H4R34_000939 [Dimargaris verticillata]|uniref:P53 and DNA damage-regulated protein 1 n=1 Tax=Dimargaris verticillata TaxID=2761393 RepID=A0A9W8EE84_9FUNG|nr:hypothetical protein H4R34_000939 [Dimargaris verticillata]